MHDVATGFGARLRETRSQLGLSQRELARDAGVHYATIGKIETGTRDTSPGAELEAQHRARLYVEMASPTAAHVEPPVRLLR